MTTPTVTAAPEPSQGSGKGSRPSASANDTASFSRYALGTLLKSLGLGGAVGTAAGMLVQQRWPEMFGQQQLAIYVCASLGIVLHRALGFLVEWILSPVARNAAFYNKIIHILFLKRKGLLGDDQADELMEAVTREFVGADPDGSLRQLFLRRQRRAGGHGEPTFLRIGDGSPAPAPGSGAPKDGRPRMGASGDPRWPDHGEREAEREAAAEEEAAREVARDVGHRAVKR